MGNELHSENRSPSDAVWETLTTIDRTQKRKRDKGCVTMGKKEHETNKGTSVEQ